MPRSQPKTQPQRTAATAPADAGVHFSVRNLVLLTSGLLVILLGYALLAGGSTTAAPLLLVAGYVVLVPLGIIA